MDREQGSSTFRLSLPREVNRLPDTVEIFTDGACQGNPGPGGWAALLRYKGVERTVSGGEPWTTNNRMELLAAISALEKLKRRCKVTITTDSQYLMLGITQWIKRWKKREWKTADNKEVKNVDLWKRLDEVVSFHDVNWNWVKGHFGHKENQKADKLARKAMKKFMREK